MYMINIKNKIFVKAPILVLSDFCPFPAKEQLVFVTQSCFGNIIHT